MHAWNKCPRVCEVLSLPRTGLKRMSVFRRVLSVAIATALPVTMAAQTTILLSAGPAATAQVALGGTLRVPLILDVTKAGGAPVASIAAQLTWNPVALTLDSVTAGTFGAIDRPMIDQYNGRAVLGVFSSTVAAGSSTIAIAWFTGSYSLAGSQLALDVSEASNLMGSKLATPRASRGLDVCVAPFGKWGDVNGDSVINILDAQQIARAAVGLSVANPEQFGSTGDVTADSTVNIIDAQQIARFAIGLSAPTRIGGSTFVMPAVASVTATPASGISVGVGSGGKVSALALSVNTMPLAGCVPVRWRSSDTTKVKVTDAGDVLGVALGSATLTATVGSKSATVTATVGASTSGTGTTLSVVAGDAQYGIANYPLPMVPTVRVLDPYGAPVVRGNVQWSMTNATLQLNGASITSAQGRTDDAGIAALPGALLLGTTPGAVTVTATLDNGANVTFNLGVIATPTGQHSCRLVGSAAYCWGNGRLGQLGNGGTGGSSVPVPVSGGVTFASLTQHNTGDHMCGVSTAGVGYCWGSNSAGQVGDSSRTNRSVPTLVAGNLRFSKISTGAAHSCGLTTTGLAYCWGLNVAGQFGDSTWGNFSAVPRAVKMPTGVTFTDLSAGSGFTCAISNAGTAYCWGYGRDGALGSGTTTTVNTPTAIVGLSGLTAISAGNSHSCALTSAGAAWCWGQSNAVGDGADLYSATLVSRLSPSPVRGGHQFTEISAGDEKTCAAKADGSLWCWGNDGYGQLGDNVSSGPTRTAPVPVMGTGSQLVSGGFMQAMGHTCALATGGLGVMCWGQNGAGQLGDGTATARTLPTSVVLSAGSSSGAATMRQDGGSFQQAGVINAAVASAPTLAIRDSRSNGVAGVTVTFSVVSGGGSVTGGTTTTNASGSASVGSWVLGSAVGIQVLKATAAMANGTSASVLFYAKASAVSSAVSMVKVDGDSVTMSYLYPMLTPTVRVLTASGTAASGIPVTFAFSSGGSKVATSDSTGLAVLSVDSLVLGVSLATPSTVTIAASAPGVASGVTFTYFHPGLAGGLQLRNTHCALAKAGTVYCWGEGERGQLGDGTTTGARNYARPVSGSQVFAKISDGFSQHACALTAAGAAYCWGANHAGQLGDGTTTDRSTPIAVATTAIFTQIVTLESTTCALTTSGSVYCWGYMQSSGMGHVELRDRRSLSPVLVTLGTASFKQIALWGNGICGVTPSGEVQCAGDNSAGTVGDGTFTNRFAFTSILGGLTVARIAGSTVNMCAVTTSGNVACWGVGGSTGALGDGTTTDARNFPAEIVPDDGRFVDVSIGNFSVCARRVDGHLFCWGSNAGGQLGLGDLQTRTSPVELQGMSFVDAGTVSFRGRCGRVVSGELYCWGQNSYGQLGDSTTVVAAGGRRTTPAMVVGWPDGPGAGIAATILPTTAWLNGQSANAGATLTTPPQVLVRDRLGRPVVGTTVTFSILSGGGTLIGSIVKTDSTGLASTSGYILPSTAAAVTIGAVVDGLPMLTLAVNSVVTNSPAAVAMAFGNQQRQFAGAALPGSIGVIVRDAGGNPLSGITVSFAVTAGAGSLPATAVTDANGIAKVTYTLGGTPSTTNTATATVSGLSPVTFTATTVGLYSLDNGSNANCALTSTGSAACWGFNSRGQIGDGTLTARNVPTAVSGGLTFTKLSVGTADHTCGLTAAGAAYCWGSNSFGEIGDSTYTDATAPVAVKGSLVFTQLAVSRSSSCGLTAAGAMYCWGSNDLSLLGDGVLGTTSLTPQLVNTGGVAFSQMGVGRNLACGLSSAGALYCWGGGSFTADGTTGGSPVNAAFTVRPTPTRVNDGRSYTQLRVGEQFACGITTTSTTLCWGQNSQGQLGNGSSVNRTSPTEVVTTQQFVSLALGISHACGLNAAGALWCWGYASTDGRLADGTTTTTSRTLPVAALGGLTLTSVRLSGSNSCGISTGGVPFCAGTGSNGAIGNNTANGSAVLTPTNWITGTAGTAIAVIANTNPAASAAVGSTLSNALSVKVRDYTGNGVSNATVTFTVTTGGGSLSSTSVVTTTTVVTSGSGVATLPAWILGSTPGINTVTATVSGLGNVVFTVTGI